MMKYLTTILSLLTINFALAAEKQKVTVRRSDGVWQYSVQSFMGPETVKLIPVTREAAIELKKLGKDSRLECVVQDGTLVTYGKESSGGIYYILDIKCD